jgi:hypothetical protein
LRRTEFELSPFAYVDTKSGEIRYLTKLMSDDATDEILAFSVAEDGDMELLSTEN